MRKKFAEFVRKLCRERLVVCNDERRLLDLLNYVRDGERLAGARNAQKRLVVDSFFETRNQFLYRLRLVTGRLIIRYQFKFFSGHFRVFFVFTRNIPLPANATGDTFTL